MLKRTYARIAVSLILATAAPAVTPAMSVQAASIEAASFTSASQTAAALSLRTTVRFVQKSGKTFCLTSDGKSQTGWVQNSGKWYYFDKKDGHMLTGWLKLGTRKFYLRKDGSMVEGPGWYTISGKKYYFTKNGHVRAAWEMIGGKWYYRNTEGSVVKSRWIKYADKYYYLTSTGAAATGTVSVSGKKYRFGSNGDLQGTVPANVIAAAKAYAREVAAAAKAGTSSSTSSAKTAAAAAVKTTSSTDTKTASSSTAKTTAAAGTKSSSATSTSASKSTASTAKTTKTTTVKKITKVTGKLNNLPESKRKFVIDVANYVRKYAPKYGIKVYSPIIAQAIHESGWGESSLAYKYHNYFGMKCGTLWTGKSVNLSTKEEYTAGTLTTIRDNFRVYDNMEQGVKGYFEFISRPRYANLKGVTSARQYLQNIKNDGYATGSQYVDHTMAVIEIYNLTQFDK